MSVMVIVMLMIIVGINKSPILFYVVSRLIQPP